MELALGIGLILVLIILNGVFSMAETAIVSARKARLQQRAEAGSKQAAAALDLANHPDRILSTAQIFITLIGVLSGAFGEQRISAELVPRLQAVGVPKAYSATVSFWLVMAGITFASLVLGELAPKRIALNNSEGIAALVALPMQGLARVTHPLVALLSVATNGVLRLFGIRASTDPPITEEEVRILIAQGTQAGVFEDAEQDIVERVFRLGDRRAGSLMTPRTEMVWVDMEDPPEETWLRIRESHHSNLPLCQGQPDQILGMITLKRLISGMGDRPPSALTVDDLKAAAIPPVLIPSSVRAYALLDRFKRSEQHVAIVLDEYGGTLGLVTLHDVMEALVGDVHNDPGPHDSPAIQREDGSWLLDGMLERQEFAELLGVALPPGDHEYLTIGGYLMGSLGRVPVAGDTFSAFGLRFEVMDMDGNRVDKVLVHRVPPAE